MSVASFSQKTGSIKSRSRLSSAASSFKDHSGSGSSRRRSSNKNSSTPDAAALAQHAQEKVLKEKYKLPEFKLREKNTQHVDTDTNMYVESKLGFSKKDIKSRKKKMEDELTIFAPKAADDGIPGAETEIKMERPVTPVNIEIKKQPLDWDSMSQFVRRRMAPDRTFSYLSPEDQTDLAEILVAEVYHIWPDIKRQIDDPFLTPQDNKELNRRIAVHIVTVCEQLYQHYLEKAEILMKRGVFSGPANMSRLKASLGIEASKYLNILMIRRYIVADMKGDMHELESVSDLHPGGKSSSRPPISKMSFKGMLKQSRPKKKQEKRQWKTIDEDLRDLKDSMPDLETSKLLKVLADMPRDLLEGGLLTMHESEERGRSFSQFIDTESFQPTTSVIDKEAAILKTYESKFKPESSPLKRCNSLPEIHPGEDLLQELGIEKPSAAEAGLATSSINTQDKTGHKSSYEGLYVDAGKEKGHEEKISQKAAKVGLSRDEINQDLKKLIEVKKEPDVQIPEEDDLPPLLQALIRHRKHDGMEEVHKRKIAELEEKERKEKEERSKPLQEPEHPQPATVAQKLPDKTIVRTSDIRVSERVCMESITIQQHKTVFNDLLDEIDSATVKKLDSNLFLGEEIKEVYTEIMKTVPTDHLNCEQTGATNLVREDELIQKAPEALELDGLLASVSLTKRKRCDRMINPNLKVHHEAPWGSSANNKAEWSKTPSSPPKNSKGGDNFDPLVPNTDNIAFASDPHSGKIGGINLSDLPVMVAERMARAYASWLTWWRGNIDSEDYLKYLSTRETDYLGVSFHFYDSDAEDDDDDDPIATKTEILAQELEQKRAEKLAELRNKKGEYESGMWNIQTVSLGGLGRDPNVEDDVEINRIKSAIQKEVDEAQNKKKFLGDILKDRSRSPGSRNMTPFTAMTSKGYSRMESAISGKTASTKASAKKPPSFQERMEKVWSSLLMPDNIKLDMAIKYSSEQYVDCLEQVISAWEAATRMVLQRESFITELERFERLASDPNRFFEHGKRGSSNARFKEARFRNQIHLKLENIHKGVRQAVTYVEETYGDVVTYQGRPYVDKMKFDKTEMLYWLQEERKQNAIELYQTFKLKQPVINQTLEI